MRIVDEIDDGNDDNLIDTHEGLTIVKSLNGNQPLKVLGQKPLAEREFSKRVLNAKSSLTEKENLVMSLIGRGYSILETAGKLGISRQAVQKTWERIREKLNGI